MINQLVIVNLRREAREQMPALLNGLEWQTCLRRILFLNASDHAELIRSLEAGEIVRPVVEVFRGQQAYEFLLEVICGLNSPIVGETAVMGQFKEFLQHANDEQGHADQIAARIIQLGGAPNFSPEGILARSHSEYVEGVTLVDMIKEDLVAERVAIDTYTEMIHYIAEKDITTRRMLEGLLAVEEEHADDLASFLADIEKDWKTRDRKTG